MSGLAVVSATIDLFSAASGCCARISLTHNGGPDISSATPAPPKTRSRLNRPAMRLPAIAGANAKK